MVILLYSCREEPGQSNNENKTLFTSISSIQSGIDFQNNITESVDFNFLYYGYMYNGGGVATGDINNDGLIDIFFTANQGPNKLYLNKGDFKFEDISSAAGVEDATGWKTGVTMVDINNDGLLDIYVCKSASVGNADSRRNKLFLNNGDNTFSERAAAFGIDDPAFSTQAYFLDIENDGDLDMYLVNHRPDFNNNTKISSDIQRDKSMETSDQLYRNEGGRFVNITSAAGLLNKTWGLSAAIADFNKDGYDDIYICNDFLEPDQLLINQKNGQFKDEVLKYMKHISFYSMGSDMADINNDNELDLVVLDMVSEDHVRSKRNMAAMSNSVFRSMVNIGYHHQYMANMLQLNNGNQSFSEIGQLAGISKTDWSWAPLLADFDNDGLKDLYVTNGIKRDVTDNDYKIELRKKNQEGASMSLDEIFNLMPASKQKNYAFKNMGDLSFKKMAAEWGIDDALLSNGAAYADLDNDGDLDLVVNNIDDEASLYENKSTNNYLSIRLKGPGLNPLAIGSKVRVWNDHIDINQELYLSRGFQSSVSPVLNFGLNKEENVNVEVTWPRGRTSILNGVKSNQILDLDILNAQNARSVSPINPIFSSLNDPSNFGVSFSHTENEYDDFINEILLPQKQSTIGPALAVADVNGDGKDDFFIGGARAQGGKIYIQNGSGFDEGSSAQFDRHASYEDTGAAFFDLEGDGDKDLYVVSGGNESPEGSQSYQDRIYINDGNGNFQFTDTSIPQINTSGKCVIPGDIDGDGDEDLFVGGRQVPGKYPFPSDSYILINDNGRLMNESGDRAPEFENLGMVTDASFSDYDRDGDLDLIVVGKWMAIQIFQNENGHFSSISSPTLSNSNGWWYSIESTDIDRDGDEDYVIGNLGTNNKFGASIDKPFHIYCDDFDDNGTYDIVLSKEGKNKLLPVRGRECSSEQMPFIQEKFPSYKQFAEAGLQDIYGEKLTTALHYEAYTFESSILVNNGQDGFELRPLPNEAQFGPTMASVVRDINRDGIEDIVGVGSIFNAEVETIRYDANRGYILIGQPDGSFKGLSNSGFYNDYNAKDVKFISINGESYFLIANNDGPLRLVKQLNT